MDKINSDSYVETLKIIKERIYKAQYKALQQVNKELITLYRDIGRMIFEKQQLENWGNQVIERIAHDLSLEFDGIRGFSTRNVWNMRKFYLEYRDNEILQSLSAELGWSHNLIIIERCQDIQEREFYIRMAIKQSWSVRTLENKIQFNEYHKWLTSQSNYRDTLPIDISTKAEMMLKDEYNFDFLLLDDEHNERDLELAILKNMRKVLEEFGTDFAFIGNQKRITLENNEGIEEEFFIDLLFYHRRLKSLVAIELKADKFKPESAGKMSFYLTLLDEHERLEGENPPVGIIICKDKNRTIVEYSLKSINQPIGIATYKSYNNDKDLPNEYLKYLPSISKLGDRLFALTNLE